MTLTFTWAMSGKSILGRTHNMNFQICISKSNIFMNIWFLLKFYVMAPTEFDFSGIAHLKVVVIGPKKTYLGLPKKD